jgi:hypothetical protein
MAFDFFNDRGFGFIDNEKHLGQIQTFLGERELMKRFLESLIRMQKLFREHQWANDIDPAKESGCKYHEYNHTQPCDSS